MTKLELLQVPVPIATDTYSPVSHRNIIDAVGEQLYKRNMQIHGEKYNSSADGKKVIGYYDIIYDNNPEMGMRLAFRNSYDKSMSVAIASGANVFVCSNGMVKADGLVFMRKHTGSVVQDLNTIIVTGVEQLENHFITMTKHSQQMKQIELTKVKAAEMYGRMFMIDDIITPTQLNIVKRELDNSKFEEFREESLWSAYNHVTYALKESHPLNYIDQHVNLHKFVEQEFQLV